jgi:quaternary ammonium compound-resistance protein SugE
MQWFYLVVASIFEIGWLFSLKSLNMDVIKKISIHSLLEKPIESIVIFVPLLGYVILGIGNIFFFSLAIWMAITLAGVKMVETFFYKESIRPLDYLFLFLLLVAIIGLKKNS